MQSYSQSPMLCHTNINPLVAICNTRTSFRKGAAQKKVAFLCFFWNHPKKRDTGCAILRDSTKGSIAEVRGAKSNLLVMSTSLCNRSQPVPVSSVTSPSIMPRNTGSAPLQHLGREKWNDHEKNQALRFPLRELVGSLPHTRLSTSKFKQ